MRWVLGSFALLLTSCMQPKPLDVFVKVIDKALAAPPSPAAAGGAVEKE